MVIVKQKVNSIGKAIVQLTKWVLNYKHMDLFWPEYITEMVKLTSAVHTRLSHAKLDSIVFARWQHGDFVGARHKANSQE